jgi:hypothetical protein
MTYPIVQSRLHPSGRTVLEASVVPVAVQVEVVAQTQTSQPRESRVIPFSQVDNLEQLIGGQGLQLHSSHPLSFLVLPYLQTIVTSQFDAVNGSHVTSGRQSQVLHPLASIK